MEKSGCEGSENGAQVTHELQGQFAHAGKELLMVVFESKTWRLQNLVSPLIQNG